MADAEHRGGDQRARAFAVGGGGIGDGHGVADEALLAVDHQQRPAEW